MRITCTLILLAIAALAHTQAAAQTNVGQITRAEVQLQPIPQARPLYRPDTVKIVVLGDIMMHTLQIKNALKGDSCYNFNSYFRHIENRIKEADIAIGNMEYTLSGLPYTGYPCFSAPDSFPEYLARTGFDIFLCANNHIFDKGAAGAERTIRMYENLSKQYGILHTGLRTEVDKQNDSTLQKSNIPLSVARKGIRIAILNFTYGTNSSPGKEFPKVNRLTDRHLIKQAFSEVRDTDIIIALPHWGTEYVLRHSASQRRDAEFLAEEGADIIIGSHPHVVQDYEHINGVPVIYSLGNAVSNMSAPNTQVELMAEINIIRQSNGDLSVLEPELTWLWCSRPGGYGNSYTVIPIEEFIGRRTEWNGEWDYDKMISSWIRVSSATGIRRSNNTDKNDI